MAVTENSTPKAMAGLLMEDDAETLNMNALVALNSGDMTPVAALLRSEKPVNRDVRDLLAQYLTEPDTNYPRLSYVAPAHRVRRIGDWMAMRSKVYEAVEAARVEAKSRGEKVRLNDAKYRAAANLNMAFDTVDRYHKEWRSILRRLQRQCP